MVLIGRVPESNSAKYLAASRLSGSKDLAIVAFSPMVQEGGANQDHFDKLFKFHSDRQ